MAKKLNDHDQAVACECCGSVKWNLLKSGGIECAKCGAELEAWWAEGATAAVRTDIGGEYETDNAA